MKIKTPKIKRFSSWDHFKYYFKRLFFFWRKYGVLDIKITNSGHFLNACMKYNMTIEQFVTKVLENAVKDKEKSLEEEKEELIQDLANLRPSQSTRGAKDLVKKAKVINKNRRQK
jgi:hypothetical protein